MSHPYSDNPYPMLVSDSEEEQLVVDSQQHSFLRHGELGPEEQRQLHQADGYFDASSTPSHDQDVSGNSAAAGSSLARGPSNRVPYIPNVMVHDPSLRLGSTIEDKAIGLGRDVFNAAPSHHHLGGRRFSGEAHSRRASSPPDPGFGGPGDEDDIYSSNTPRTSTSTRGSRQPREQVYRHQRSQSQALAADMGHPRHPEHHSPSPTGSARRDSLDGRQPLIPNEAPPAYTPRSPTALPTQTTGYSSFPPNRYNPNIDSTAMGRPGEASPLLGRHAQGIAPAGGMGVPNGLGNSIPKFKEKKKRQGRVCLVLALVFGFSVLASIPMGLWTNRPTFSPLPPNEPVNDPSKGPGGDLDKSPNMPHDSDGVPVAFPPSKCKDGAIQVIPTQTFPVSFAGSESLDIREVIRKNQAFWDKQLGIYGSVSIRPLEGRSKDGKGAIDVEIMSNLPELADQVGLSFDSSGQSLEVSLPRIIEDWEHSDSMPCAVVKVTLWVPDSGASLASLGIHTVHLDTYFAENLDLKLERLKVDTVIGAIGSATPKSVIDNPAPWTSRSRAIEDVRAMPSTYKLYSGEAEAETNVGDIVGTFHLAEKLRLETISGNIGIMVVPMDINSKGLLEIHSTAGDVTVEEVGVKEGKVPARDYETIISTQSGEINARVAFGAVGNFENSSGDQKLELLPVVNLQALGVWMGLHTKSQNGDMKIKLMEPMYYGGTAVGNTGGPGKKVIDVGEGDPYQIPHPDFDGAEEALGGGKKNPVSLSTGLGVLASQHEIASGNLKLAYPESWEGFLHLESGTGTISACGDRLKVTRTSRLGPKIGEVLEALNGVHAKDEGSYLKASAMAGDVKLDIGSSCRRNN